MARTINKKLIAGLASIVVAGVLVATSLAVGGSPSGSPDRIAPRAHAKVALSRPKGQLIDHGSHLSWRVNGEEGVSFR